MVEKIRKNENGPRVVRSFVRQTGQRAKQKKVDLWKKDPYVKLTCFCDDCHSIYWFKEYVSGQEKYTGAGVIENENGPCARRRGPRITGQMFTRKKSSTSSMQRSAARDITWYACVM